MDYGSRKYLDKNYSLFINRRVCKVYGVKKCCDMDNSLFINRCINWAYSVRKNGDMGGEYYKGRNKRKGLNLFKDSSPLFCY